MKTKQILFVTLFFFTAGIIKAQYIEDALRFSQHSGFITPRAGGLGVAFNGIADDFSALAFNPAGISLVAKSEFSLGFGFTRNSDESNFLNHKTDFSSNNAYITHLGIVVPFKTDGGNNAAIGIGYYMEDNYDNTIKYSGFNPHSTFINYEASRGNPISWNLFLTPENDSTFTPIKDSLQQSGFIQESGGLHNVVGGISFDLNPNFAIGISITGKWGTYNYNRRYMEEDIYNIYNRESTFIGVDTFDLNNMILTEKLAQDISGITGAIGFQARIADFLRVGGTIKFPTFYDITEDFSTEATANFDNGGTIDPPYTSSGQNGYKVTTPFVYSGGVSVHAANITFTAGVEWSDATQLKFSDGPDGLENLNMSIKENLVAQTTWGVGAEYEVPLMPIVARASFTSTTSPYIKDVPGATLQTVALGGGIYLAKNVRLDGLFRWSSLSFERTNYGTEEYNKYITKWSPLDIGLQLTYRY